MRGFAFFGYLGLTFPFLACSASSTSSAPGINSGAGGQYNVGTGGSGFDPNQTTAGTGTGNESEGLQADGSLLLKGVIRDFRADFPDMEPEEKHSQKLSDIGEANIEQNSTPSDRTRDCTKPIRIKGVDYPSTCIVHTTLDPLTQKPT